MSSVLMGQHKAGLSSGLHQGCRSPRGGVASANWLGDSHAAVKQAVARIHQLSISLSLMKHKFSEMLGKKGGGQMSGTTTRLGWIQRM